MRTREGWVYVMTNPLFPMYRKIGETGRTVSKRQSELRSGYGTEEEWDKESKHWTTDRRAVEALAHRLLHRQRVKGSEMFKCSAAKAKQTALKAIRIVEVRRRHWYWRLWYSIVLPRPERAPQRLRRARYWLLEWDGLALVFLAVWGFFALIHYKPDVPDWLPEPVARTAVRIESWR